MNPVNVLNTLAKVLAEGKGGIVRFCLKKTGVQSYESRLAGLCSPATSGIHVLIRGRPARRVVVLYGSALCGNIQGDGQKSAEAIVAKCLF